MASKGIKAAIEIEVDWNSLREKGMIKWFDSKRGFGFVTPKAGGEDLFVHKKDMFSSLINRIDENE